MGTANPSTSLLRVRLLKYSTYSIVCMYRHTYSKSLDQPGKVASPARGQLNRKNEYFPVRVHKLLLLLSSH